MVCNNCGKEIEDGSFFCAECGAAVPGTTGAFADNSVNNQGAAVSGTTGAFTDNPSPNPEAPGSYGGYNQNQYYSYGNQRTANNGKKGGNGAVIAVIAIVLTLALLSVAGLVFFIVQIKNIYDIIDDNSDEINDSNYEADYDDYDYDYDYDYDDYDDYDDEDISVEYIFPQSDSAYLYITDIKGLSAYQCSIARNEIYARHGRMFDDPKIQGYFESCSWYKGTVKPEDFSESVLNPYEIANINTIVEYEEYMGYR